MKKVVCLMTTILLVPFNSCSTRKDMGSNQKKSGHFRLYTYPKHRPAESDDRYKRIVVISINDLKGKFTPQESTFHNARFNQTVTLRSGGFNGVKAYLDIFKQVFQGETLVLDAGSFVDPTNLKSSIFYYNSLGIDAATLGAQEFTIPNDFKAQKLQESLKKTNFSIVATNLFDLKTLENVKWSNTQLGVLKTVNGIKVGILGLTDPELAIKFPGQNVTGLYFQNMAKVVIENANLLRRKGAQIIVAMVNSELDCTKILSQELDLPDQKVNFDINVAASCDSSQSGLIKLLKQIPPNHIDVVVTGGKESKVANFINGHPVMQNYGGGNYLSWLELYYDTKLKVVVHDKTLLHQPVATCHQFMQESQDCYPEALSKEVELVPAEFLDKKVEIGTYTPKKLLAN